MKLITICIHIILVLIPFSSITSQNIPEYLRSNRADLYTGGELHLSSSVKVIGFCALHGSAKTEEAEVLLLSNLIQNKQLNCYIMETDPATAEGFMNYIETGDEKLLKDLVQAYGLRVPQEASIEVFGKWKKVRNLFKENGIKVYGIDKIACYKFPVTQLLNLIKPGSNHPIADSIQTLVNNPETDWQAYYYSEVRNLIKRFIQDYESHKSTYDPEISNADKFAELISQIKSTWSGGQRETEILGNYTTLLTKNQRIKTDYQFFRLGVFHLMKSKINGASGFFSMLIQKGIYSSDQIAVVQGFFSNSKVLWDIRTDKNGNYAGYTAKGGSGTGDSFFESFKGITDLKEAALSDLTLFNLSGDNSPYTKGDCTNLIYVKMKLGRSPWEPESGKHTTDYITYALLIRNSSADTPIQELKE